MIQKGIMIASAGLVIVFLIAVLGRAHSTVVLITSSNESIPFRDVEASFAPRIPGGGIIGAIYVAKPLNACVKVVNLAPEDRQYSPFLVVERGECTFEFKVRNAQDAGYAAVIVYNDQDGEDLVTMSGDSMGIYINAVFVSKGTADVLLRYVEDMDTRCYMLPTFENTAWSVMAVSFISLLAVSTVLSTFFFVRRHRLRQISSRFLSTLECPGLSTHEVKALPVIIFKSSDANVTADVCAICLEDYDVDDKLRVLPCYHDFHAVCVDHWLTTRRPFCPICKRDAHSKHAVSPPSEHTPLLSSVSTQAQSTLTTTIPIPAPVPSDARTFTGIPPYSVGQSLSPNQQHAISYMLPDGADGRGNISPTPNMQGLLSCSPRNASHQWSTATYNMILSKNSCSAPVYAVSSGSIDILNCSSQGSDFC